MAVWVTKDLVSGFKGSCKSLLGKKTKKGALVQWVKKNGTDGERGGTNQELLGWVTKGLGPDPGCLFQKGPPLS